MKKIRKRITAFLLLTVMLSFALKAGVTALAVESAHNSYRHSDMFRTDAPQSAEMDGCYFTYEYGADGVYRPMASFTWVNGWINAWSWSGDTANYPAVANWFIGANADKDGVIRFHSARSGEVTVSASDVYASGAKAQKLMIVQKRGDGYYPIYPAAGRFEWKNVMGEDGKFGLSVTTTLKAEDEILVIARCDDQIIVIDPVITFTGNAGINVTDGAFGAWNSVTYVHSTLFEISDKSVPKSAEIDGSYFAYQYGNDGVYNFMASYQDYGWVTAWSCSADKAVYPAVANWFIAADAEQEGVISWYGAKEGQAVITSENKIFSSAAGGELMIVQKRGDSYYPLYPTAGTFEWKALPLETEAFTLPSIMADIKAGDEILFLIRGNEDGIVQINPQISFLEGTVEDNAQFTSWPVKEKPATEEVCSHSGTFNDSDKENPKGVCENGSYFTYEFGKSGKYEPMTRFSINKWYQAWTAYGEEPEICSWFISSDKNVEGAIIWHSNNDGELTIKSRRMIATDHPEQVAEFMIVQRRNGKIYPVYPSTGKFEWKQITNTEYQLPQIKTSVVKDDTIEFIVRSKDRSVVKIDPQISFYAQENTNQLKDSDFFEFPILKEESNTSKVQSPLTGDDATDLYLLLECMMIAAVLAAIPVYGMNAKRIEKNKKVLE